MFKGNKWILIVMSGTLVLAAAVGFLLISELTTASAAWIPSGQIASTINTDVGPDTDGFNHRGRPGFPGRGPGDVNDFLAQALGISSEELQAAHERAQQAALDQALADGMITQEQYDRMVLRGYDRLGGRGGSRIDFEVLLAAELGISVETLQAARERANQAAIEQAIADGKLTEEQAAMMRARAALQDYINPEALLAQALNMTVEQLQTAREAGKSISEILEDQGLTAVEVRDAQQVAHQAAIQQAVDDGVITPEQAEQFQNGFRGGPPMDGFRHPGCSGRRGHGGFPGEGEFGFPQSGPKTGTNGDL